MTIKTVLHVPVRNPNDFHLGRPARLSNIWMIHTCPFLKEQKNRATYILCIKYTMVITFNKNVVDFRQFHFNAVNSVVKRREKKQIK